MKCDKCGTSNPFAGEACEYCGGSLDYRSKKNQKDKVQEETTPGSEDEDKPGLGWILLWIVGGIMYMSTMCDRPPPDL